MNPKSTYLETLSLLTSFNEVELDLIKRCLEVKKYAKGEFLLKWSIQKRVGSYL